MRRLLGYCQLYRLCFKKVWSRVVFINERIGEERFDVESYSLRRGEAWFLIVFIKESYRVNNEYSNQNICRFLFKYCLVRCCLKFCFCVCVSSCKGLLEPCYSTKGLTNFWFPKIVYIHILYIYYLWQSQYLNTLSIWTQLVVDNDTR